MSGTGRTHRATSRAGRNQPHRNLFLPFRKRACPATRLWLTAAACLLLVAAPALSRQLDRGGFRTLNNVVTPEIFQEICDLLELDETQYQDASQSFSTYFQRVKSLEVEYKQLVEDAGLREANEILQEARYKGTKKPWGRIAELQRQLRAVSVVGKRKNDSILEEWYGEIQGLLTEDQQERFYEARRLARRLEMLHKEANKLFRDFRGRIDLIAFIDDIRQERSELAYVFQEERENKSEEIQVFQDELREILDSYAFKLDNRLLKIIKKGRTLLKPDYQAVYYDGDPKLKKLGKSWAQDYDYTKFTVNQIAESLRRIGKESLAQAWEERYRQTLCPALYAERWPDRMVDWLKSHPDETMLQQPDLVLEQQQLVSTLFDEYLEKRRVLRISAIAAGAKAKRKHYLESGVHTPAQRNYVRMLLKLRTLTKNTISRFRGFLTTDQNRSLDIELDRIKIYVGPGLHGPFISPEAIEALTGIEQPRGILLPPIDPRTGVRDPNYGKYDDEEE